MEPLDKGPDFDEFVDEDLDRRPPQFAPDRSYNRDRENQSVDGQDWQR
jgi:hypothetical protein